MTTVLTFSLYVYVYVCAHIYIYVYNFPILGMKETCENTNKDCGKEIGKQGNGRRSLKEKVRQNHSLPLK